MPSPTRRAMCPAPDVIIYMPAPAQTLYNRLRLAHRATLFIARWTSGHSEPAALGAPSNISKACVGRERAKRDATYCSGPSSRRARQAQDEAQDQGPSPTHQRPPPGEAQDQWVGHDASWTCRPLSVGAHQFLEVRTRKLHTRPAGSGAPPSIPSSHAQSLLQNTSQQRPHTDQSYRGSLKVT